MKQLLFFWTHCFSLIFSLALGEIDYRERLDITPLVSSYLLVSFQFWSNASSASYKQQHFKHIPRSLAQILQHARTEELHLRFSTGRWDDENWGLRPHNGWKEGATGVEVWAWVTADSEPESFDRWNALNNALSGLFCASLNFVDSTRTTRPQRTFEPTGDLGNKTADSLYLLHGTLPREVVCTENLTPFLKLLPCKGQAGIASLLDGHKLFDASWQSMALDMRSVCPTSQADCSIEIEQTVDMVLETERSKRPRDNPIPRPGPKEALLCDSNKPYTQDDACFPADDTRGQSWTVAELFGRPVRGSCLAENKRGQTMDTVCLNIPPEREIVNPSAVPQTNASDGTGRCFAIPPREPFELILSHLGPQSYNKHKRPRLYASRSITGHGQERGGVQTLLENPSMTTPADFVYFETLPWFMKPYIHTLTARLSTSQVPSTEVIKETYYRPALDRMRGTQLELLVSVPPNSTVYLTYKFDKAILRYTEYPPDANRGFDIAPAVIRLLPTTSGQANINEPSYIRTTSLLLPLPTPDFSMPYNVIILTSTVIALAFGSIFNILVRRFVGADETEGAGLATVRAKIKARYGALRARFSGKSEKKSS